MNLNPVIHVEMPSDDGARMSCFHETAFGWQTRAPGAGIGHYITAATAE
jgi:predicted enzyme related to lactoylglutathione lyase